MSFLLKKKLLIQRLGESFYEKNIMLKFIKKLFGTKYDKDKSLYQPIVDLVHDAEEK
jgi:hypothetical protein